MRDAARRTAPPPCPAAVRAAPRGPCSARHISQNTSIIAWCVSPQRARTREVARRAVARPCVPVQAVRGARVARAGRARRPGRQSLGGRRRLASPCALSCTLHGCARDLATRCENPVKWCR